jgi:hypothetical protein
VDRLGANDDISAHSDALGEWLKVTCDERGTVVCTTGAGSELRIPQSALDGYTREMADEYAGSHTASGNELLEGVDGLVDVADVRLAAGGLGS